MSIFYFLGVGAPRCSILCQFWLCEEAQCVHLRRHLGSTSIIFKENNSVNDGTGPSPGDWRSRRELLGLSLQNCHEVIWLQAPCTPVCPCSRFHALETTANRPIFFKYILLIMIYQLSPFSLSDPFHLVPPITSSNLPLSSHPWALHIISLATPFLMLFLISPYFVPTNLCFLIPASFPSSSP